MCVGRYWEAKEKGQDVGQGGYLFLNNNFCVFYEHFHKNHVS